MKKTIVLWFAGAAFLLSLCPAVVLSQSVDGRKIKELYIKGNSSVSGAVIRKCIKMTPERTFRMADAN